MQQALQALQPWLKTGEGWSTISIANNNSGIAWQEDDLTAVTPYSPISGKRNPVAVPLKLWKSAEGGKIRMLLQFHR